MSDVTVDQILDAALETVAVHGLRRTSIGDIAATAGLSRPTLYKYVGNRDEIFAATIQRGVERFADDMFAPVPDADPVAGLEVAMLRCLRRAREHPLLDRIVRTEPAELVPLLTADDGPVSATLRRRAEHFLATLFPGLDEIVARRSADLLVRVLVSFVINTPDDPPEIVARSTASIIGAGIAHLHASDALSDISPERTP